MSMSRKDFVALADALRYVKADLSENVLNALCYFCKGQNYAFKEGLFRAYLNGECGSRGGSLKGAGK